MLLQQLDEAQQAQRHAVAQMQLLAGQISEAQRAGQFQLIHAAGYLACFEQGQTRQQQKAASLADLMQQKTALAVAIQASLHKDKVLARVALLHRQAQQRRREVRLLHGLEDLITARAQEAI